MGWSSRWLFFHHPTVHPVVTERVCRRNTDSRSRTGVPRRDDTEHRYHFGQYICVCVGEWRREVLLREFPTGGVCPYPFARQTTNLHREQRRMVGSPREPGSISARLSARQWEAMTAVAADVTAHLCPDRGFGGRG